MKLLIGLGNPGLIYKYTRHNIGFRIIDSLSVKHEILVKARKFSSFIGEGRICRQKTILIKPQTFMNLSGEAVRAAKAFYKITLEDILIICDDVNLPLGALRLRKKGSDGGHKGLRSIIESIAIEDFPRLRVGIGRSTVENTKDYVLKCFDNSEKDAVSDTITRAGLVVELWIKSGIDMAMNLCNS